MILVLVAMWVFASPVAFWLLYQWGMDYDRPWWRQHGVDLPLLLVAIPTFLVMPAVAWYMERRS